MISFHEYEARHINGISIFVLAALVLVLELGLFLANSQHSSQKWLRARVGEERLKPPRMVLMAGGA
jgi:hypothetical protein